MQEQAERPQAKTTPNRQSGDAGTPAPDNDFVVRAPSISLPKGGGAIRGIGEKFAANPVTGTASLSVPIYTSPGRSGFGPELSLSYDSGAGNGPFGFGWNLSLPSITRKTDKGQPQYQDANESDVFILSGAEDLVPVMIKENGQWDREELPVRTVDGEDFRIQRYRPRIEGLFARIERWTRVSDGEICWRSISRDNVTTWYGKTDKSRIADPDEVSDPNKPTLRVFSRLICESYDDKGNAIVYEYASEDSRDGARQSGLLDATQANERNRSDKTRSANRYLKRIKFGNRTPNRDSDRAPTYPSALADEDWMFEVVFDYDEGHYEALDPVEPVAEHHRFVRASALPRRPWNDPSRTWEVRRHCQTNGTGLQSARSLQFQAASRRHAARAAERFCLKRSRRFRW